MLRVQVRTNTVRIALRTHAQARANVDATLKSLSSKRALESSDIFFSCDESAASASTKDLQHLSVALDSLLKKAGSNFELGITSTKVTMSPTQPKSDPKISPHSSRTDLM
jgi:hypothetical protein